MKRLLIIEDEVIYQKMITRAVQPLGLEITTADDGTQGVRSAQALPPDIIICDVMMPKLSGYEVTRLLRRDPRFAHIPILILTAQVELNDKLEAFEAGADDHMTKPFEPAELVARVNVLLRRTEGLRLLTTSGGAKKTQKAHVIAVHTLRGGIGCTSLAANLAIGLIQLWGKPVLLMDLVLTTGQVALMINATLKRTWADMVHTLPEELDLETLQSIIGVHESGIHYIASPTFPAEAELLTSELFAKAFELLRTEYEYIVVDLPHDYSGMALQVLDEADTIVAILAPELASARAALAALDTYRKLEYPPEKIRLVLNYTYDGKWLPRKKIETALKHPIELVIPYAHDLFVEAINLGRPVISGRTQENICEVLELIAAQVSRPEHRSSVSAAKTLAWQAASKRLLS